MFSGRPNRGGILGGINRQGQSQKSAEPPAEITVTLQPIQTHLSASATATQMKTPKSNNERKEKIARRIDILTVPELVYVGLEYVHFGKERQQSVSDEVNLNRFLEHYGVPPSAVVPFFKDLRDRFPDIHYKEALMTLNWFKEYRTEYAISGTWGYGCTKFIRNTVKDYAQKMSTLTDKKIIFGGFDERESILFSVDGVHFATNEFRLDPSAKWFDHKTNSSGLMYECAIAIRRPAIVSIRGPFPASMHDITVFRGGKSDQDKEAWDQDSLYFKMEKMLSKGKKGVGDSGYGGEPDKIIITHEFHSSEMKEFLARVKNRGESLFIRLKSFGILRDRFRHGSNTENKMRLHGFCTKAICVIVQYDYENERPPFQVY